MRRIKLFRKKLIKQTYKFVSRKKLRAQEYKFALEDTKTSIDEFNSSLRKDASDALDDLCEVYRLDREELLLKWLEPIDTLKHLSLIRLDVNRYIRRNILPKYPSLYGSI